MTTKNTNPADPSEHPLVREDHIAKLREIEKSISSNDGASIRSRWEFGRYMLTLKNGKQLPSGLIQELALSFNRSRGELSCWMKFAERFTTEQQVSDAIRQFRTWYAITHNALTDKPRGSKPQKTTRAATTTQRILTLLEGFDAAELSDGQAVQVRVTLQNFVVQIDRVIASRRKEAA